MNPNFEYEDRMFFQAAFIEMLRITGDVKASVQAANVAVAAMRAACDPPVLKDPPRGPGDNQPITADEA